MENEPRGPTILHGPATALLEVLEAYAEIIEHSVALQSEYESVIRDLEDWSTETEAKAQVSTSTLSEIETNFNVLFGDALSCADARIILQNMITGSTQTHRFLSSSAGTTENLRARITTFGERITACFSCDFRSADENVTVSLADIPALLNNLVRDVTRLLGEEGAPQNPHSLIHQIRSGRRQRRIRRLVSRIVSLVNHVVAEKMNHIRKGFDDTAFSMRSIWNCLDAALIEIEGFSDAELYETSLSLISIPDGVNEDFHTINSWLSELQAPGGVTQRADFRG